MEDYRIGFQKMFNERNNVPQNIFYLGEVIETSPLKLSISNGKAYFIEGQNLKVCETLRTMTGTIVINGESQTFSITRNLNEGDSILCYPLDSVNFIAFDKL